MAPNNMSIGPMGTMPCTRCGATCRPAVLHPCDYCGGGVNAYYWPCTSCGHTCNGAQCGHKAQCVNAVLHRAATA